MVNQNSVLSSISFSQTSDWNIKQFFGSCTIKSNFDLKKLGTAIKRRKDQMTVEDGKKYKRITIKTNCGGVVVRDEAWGKDIKTKDQYYVKAGQLAVSKIDARNGAFGIVPPEADGAIITGNFWVYDVNPEVANIEYLTLILSSRFFMQAWMDCSNGSGNRLYLQEEKFLNYKIPIPDISIQNHLILEHNNKIERAKELQLEIYNLHNKIELNLMKETQVHFKNTSFEGLIGTVNYKDISRWDPQYLANNVSIVSDMNLVSMNMVISNFMVDEKGQSLRINTQDDKEKLFSYIGMEHVEKNSGRAYPQSVLGKEILSQTIRVPSNYVIYGKLRPYLNKYWQNNFDKQDVICSSEFFVFDTKNIDRQYFLEVLSSQIIQKQLSFLYSGARMPRINEDDFMGLKLPLPTIEKQRQIVAGISKIRTHIRELENKIFDCNKIAKGQFEEAVFGEA